MRNQENIKKEFVKKHLDALPESARGELKNSISRETRILDDFVDDMFNFLMTVPTKKLSRAPAFKFHYWNKVGDFGQHLNAATLKKVVKLAEDAGLATGTAREKKILKKYLIIKFFLKKNLPQHCWERSKDLIAFNLI